MIRVVRKTQSQKRQGKRIRSAHDTDEARRFQRRNAAEAWAIAMRDMDAYFEAYQANLLAAIASAEQDERNERRRRLDKRRRRMRRVKKR
jgi:hypothetical protein